MNGRYIAWFVIVPIWLTSCGPDLKDCQVQMLECSQRMEQAMDSGEFSSVEFQLAQVRRNHDCVLTHPKSSQIQKEEARAILVLAESINSGYRCRQSVVQLESFIENLSRLKGRMDSDSVRAKFGHALELIDDIEQGEMYPSCLEDDQNHLSRMRLTIEGMKLESSLDDFIDDFHDIMESTLIEVQEALQ